MALRIGVWTAIVLLALVALNFAACGKPRNENAGAGGVANAAAVQAAADAGNVTSIPGYSPDAASPAAPGNAAAGNAAP
jgi:hypothetical protein